MAWNRLYLKHWIKDRRLLPRDREDGRLTDDRIHEAINDTLNAVALDCNLLGERVRLALRAGQWEYPMPDNITDIRRAWFINSNGTRNPLGYVSNARFIDWRDPVDDDSTEITHFSYPHFQGRTLAFRADAPDTEDYVTQSWVTSSSIRTVIDSGINFGKTLDGTKLEPGMVVYNLTDDSYGYVEVLDTLTNTTTGTATSGTSTDTLEDTGKDFTALGVAVGDIICTPSTGVVTSYAFVKTVGTTTLTYESFQSSGSALRFESGDTYKVGKAQKIRLSEDTPHPGLREGAANTFSAGSAKATITGTTFTATTVTGSSTSGAEAGDIAIASGGSHAKVGSVADLSLTVDKWIGGIPTAGETVTVRECDKYQVQTEFRVEKVLWLKPTPSSSDTVGDESIELLVNSMINLPEEDDDPIEIPERYVDPILACLEWKAAERAGDARNVVDGLRAVYKFTVRSYTGDIYRPPVEHTMTAWGNRGYSGQGMGVKHQTLSGAKYDLSAFDL